MGFTAFVILIAGGYAQVLKDTGAVESLVRGAVSIMGGSRMVAAIVILFIGLFVTMGIGTSFGTIPIIAVIFVPLCQQIGFSPLATVCGLPRRGSGRLRLSTSDTTLGPTCDKDADGQHDLYGHLRADLSSLQHPADDRRRGRLAVSVGTRGRY
ncbi:MAG: Na+/H+ antiporter NhaC family protein [Cloacibacillus evryensis]